MNIVFVKHGKKNKRYAFEVPDFLASRVTKGMELLLETKKGLQIGTAVSGVISGDGALDVALENGAHAPLAPVVSIIPREVVRHVQERMLADIDAMIHAQDFCDVARGLMHCCELEG